MGELLRGFVEDPSLPVSAADRGRCHGAAQQLGSVLVPRCAHN
jgi:hypothetical protein